MPKDPKESGSFAKALEENYGQYLDTFDKSMPAVKPDSDYKEQVDFVMNHHESDYVTKRAQEAAMTAFQSLDDRQKDTFYTVVMDREKRKNFTLEDMKNSKEPWLFDQSVTGAPWRFAVRVLDRMLTPEQRAAAVESVRNIYPPSHEKFPKDRQVKRLQDEKIQALKSQLPDGPDKAKDAQLLDEVNDILSVPTKETADFFEKFTSHPVKVKPGSLPGFPEGKETMMRGMERLSDYAGHRSNGNYFSRPENAEKTRCFQVKSAYTYGKMYEEGLIAPYDYKGNKPTEKEVQEYREARSEVSEKTVETVKKLDEMFTKVSPEIPRNMFHWTGALMSETGNKDYGFIPLTNANRELERAVKDGDMEKIRQSREKYGALKGQFDEMMEVAKPKEGQMCMCGGNVDSTRKADGGNRVPLEYQKDFVTHSRLNGVYLLHNLSQHSGVPVEDIIKKPGESVEKIAEKHSKEYGLRRKGNIGERLTWAMRPDAAHYFTDTWGLGVGGGFVRGMEAVAGMASSPKERDELCGAAKMANAGGCYAINREGQAWEELEKSSECRKMFVQAAVFKSDDELDLLDLATGYKEGKRSLDALYAEKAQNGLDFNALTDRIDEVDKSVTDAQKEMERKEEEENRRKAEAKGVEYEPDDTPLTTLTEEEKAAALREVGLKLMDMASERDKETPGYRRLQQKTEALSMEAGGKEALTKLGANLQALRTPKKGMFMSSANSAEHQDMTRKQQDVFLKLSMLNGDKMNLPEEQRRRIESTPLSKLVRDAKNSTFEYMRLKSNNGEKKSFSEAGAARYEAAEESLKTLESLSDKLNLRSPAEKMIDGAKKEMLDNPGDRDVMKRCAAKIVLGQSMMKDPVKFPPEKQAEALQEEHLDKNIDNIVKSPTFRQFAQNAGKKLQETILKEPGKLYNSYTGAFKAAGGERTNREPKIQAAPRQAEKVKKAERKNSAPQIGGM